MKRGEVGSVDWLCSTLDAEMHHGVWVNAMGKRRPSSSFWATLGQEGGWTVEACFGCDVDIAQSGFSPAMERL